VNDAILKYDFQKNEYLLWSFAHNPSCFHSYRHTDGTDRLLFASGSQIYQYSDSATSDDGQPIEASLDFIFHLDAPEVQKHWDGIGIMTNPGCQATAQVAFCDNLEDRSRKYRTLGSLSSGYSRFLFGKKDNEEIPTSRFMFLRITEKSTDAPFTYYGCSISAENEPW
jgi:hypothetical protein